MLKKLPVVLLTLTLCLSMTTIIFAETGESNIPTSAGDKTPNRALLFAGIDYIENDFYIIGSWGEPLICITPKTDTSIDYIVINVKIIREATGRAVKTWNQTLYFDGVKFEFSEQYQLINRGAYHTTANIKCYKNNVKIDDVDIESPTKTY